MNRKIFSFLRSPKKITSMILLIGISMSLLPLASAYLIPMTNLEKYLDNELIVMGQVTSLRDLQDDSNFTPRTIYEITILQQIKGNSETNEITVVGLGSLNSTRHLDNQMILSDGQQVILLLNLQQDGFWYISPYSISSESLNPDSQFILSPLKLYKVGISIEDIHCKSNLELALKSSNGSPVCLTSESKNRLLERGWIK